MTKKTKRAPPMRNWEVPVKVTQRGYVYVRARDEESALEVVQNAAWDSLDINELADWEATGRPKVNE